MKTVYLFTNIAPHYRSSLWLSILKLNSKICFYYGRNNKIGIKEIDFNNSQFQPYIKNLYKIDNIWIKGKYLIWQKKIFSICMFKKIDVAVFLGEMYCLSTWLSAVICRAKGTEVVFWGHGIYGNEGKLKLYLRKAFYRLAHKHLLYERRAKQLMIKEGFNPTNLYIVFNSLDYDEHKKLRLKFQHIEKSDVFTFFANPTLPVLIFIGRLTPEKKLNMLLQAAQDINKKQSELNLIMIGNGPEKVNLETIGEQGLKHGWLHFTGACYNEEEIARYLSTSDLCVSPGNVGLTAIHSLSFGTPVCTHNNMSNQMPEAETITEGYNGFYFHENDVNDLTVKIGNWLRANTEREKIRKQCYEIIDEYYNPLYQLDVFKQLIENKKAEL